MGDVYEYLLGKIAAAGENGQFRTPRHIINMMVELMQPTLKDSILDPAMGSAGFLLSSAAYISEHQKKELMKTENMRYFKSGLFSGFDTDQSMLRIGAMNMMLHGVEDPHITYQDSLSGENTERDQYSLIMANPPFTGSVFQEEISKDLLGLCKTRKTELLFVALFTKMLKVGGRCACIVPDGVLFGSSKAHQAIRHELVENQQLQAVISMPSGVFKPYAGVSTAILIFTKTNAGGTENVWFYDMKADGYSLDDKRSGIKENDIPDIIARFHTREAEADRERAEQSFFVPKQEIVDNGYDLSINKYKKVEYEAVEYNYSAQFNIRIQEIGTASLKNYVLLYKKWFGRDLSSYNFYLMPLSFVQVPKEASVVMLNAEEKNFFSFVNELEDKHSDQGSEYSIALNTMVRFIKSTSKDDIKVALSQDKDAIKVNLTEEEICSRYPFDYAALTEKCKKRYSNFVMNGEYHKNRRLYG